MPANTDPTNDYLGDGVYVSYDGYHIVLAANHHENKVVSLEPAVLAALIRYIDRIYNTITTITPIEKKED